MNMVLTGHGTRARAARSSRSPASSEIARRLPAARRSRSPGPDALGRGLPRRRRRRRRAVGRHEADDGGLQRVLRGGADCDARRRDLPRRARRRLEGVHRARLPPRPRHRALDRDDDDRVPEGRRGRRTSSSSENMVLLDAPARDRGQRRGLPLHAGHVARHGRRRVPLATCAMEIWVATQDASGRRRGARAPIHCDRELAVDRAARARSRCRRRGGVAEVRASRRRGCAARREREKRKAKLTRGPTTTTTSSCAASRPTSRRCRRSRSARRPGERRRVAT